MTNLKKEDYYVKDIPLKSAAALVEKYHYSKGAGKVSVYCHGLFRKKDDELVGAAIWLPPTGPAAKKVNKKEWRKVLNLSRLVIKPEVPCGGASFLLGRSIRLIKADNRFISLVTYADTFKNHEGQIYKATNWKYDGESRPTPRWEDTSGKQIAQKSTQNRTHAEMRNLGYTLVGHFRKLRFVMHLTKE